MQDRERNSPAGKCSSPSQEDWGMAAASSFSWYQARKWRRPVCVVLSAAWLLVPGCTSKSSESPRVNQPPVIRSITLGPTPFDRRTDLIAQIDSHDVDDDLVQIRYYWYLNDQLIDSEKSPTLSGSLLKRGDQVRLEAVPFDGKIAGARLKSETITVDNTPPSIVQVGIGMKSDEQGDRLQALVDAYDRDRDIPQFLYRWTKNGRVIKEGEEDFLVLTEVRPQDLVVVEVKPRDHQVVGKVARSDPYMVGNSAPKIISSPPTFAAQNRYEYAVKAIDSDSDSVNFRLEVAPSGMVIDKATGNIVWDMKYVKPGMHRVKVAVTDEQGGFSFQEFELTVAASVPSKQES